jgi:hypothetical protein
VDDQLEMSKELELQITGAKKAESMAVAWHSIHSPPLYPWEACNLAKLVDLAVLDK